MSFLDTLKSLGLWQQQPQAQQNPYDFDPALMQQARLQSLGNIGSQIMAMSAQMTPDQRARMMANADFSGGYQTNLYNAAQMQMLSQAQKQKQIEATRAEEARVSIANMIKKTPPGRLRDAAMFFFQSGDYDKAGELLWKRERRFDPMTGGEIDVNALGEPIGSVQDSVNAGQPQIVQTSSSAAPSTDAPTTTAVGGDVDQLTRNWRSLLGDPTLTPLEARTIASQGSQKGAYDAYQEILKKRDDKEKSNLDALNKDEDQSRQLTKDQAEMANTVLDDRRAQMELPQRVVDFAQSIEDTLQMGDPTSMRALATQVLFAKVLDPGSAFMTGEADLQQSAASWSQRVGRFLSSTTEGTPLPAELVLEMRDIARQLGRRSLAKLEAIDKQAKTRARASNLSDELLGGQFPLRWNRFADPGLDETGTSRRGPPAQVLNDIENYGG